ncbi:MAG: hypothetical protein AB8B69_14055, partial [Chitinophagales bacterium]
SKKEEIIFEDGVEKKNITYISSFVFHKEEDFFIKEKTLVNGTLKSVKYFDVYRKKRLKKAKLQN